MKPEINSATPIFHAFSDSKKNSFSTNSQIDIKPTFQSFSVGELTASKEINSPPPLSDRDVKLQISESSQFDHLTTTPLDNRDVDNIGHPSFMDDSADTRLTLGAVNSSVIKKLQPPNASSERIENRKTVKEERWSLFIDELKKMSVSETSIERVNSVRNKAKHIEEIIFLVDVFEDTLGYGKFNMCIEFLRNFIKIASDNFKLIRFVNNNELKFEKKIAPLIAGMSPTKEYPRVTEELLDEGVRALLTSSFKKYSKETALDSLSMKDNCCADGHIFGVAYTYRYICRRMFTE